MPAKKTSAACSGPRTTAIDLGTGQMIEGDILPPPDWAAQQGRLAGLGLMSAGVAHDLGNLIQVIESGLRCMERRFDVDTSPELRMLSREVYRAASRATALTSRILDHVRGAVPAAATIDMAAAVLQMRPLIGWAAGPLVTVELDAPIDLPKAKCEPAGLEGAIINLVINARHAMPQGGRLSLSLHREGRKVVLRVADNGCGMSPEAARRVSEPFFTTRGERGGGGLGLAIVSAFMRDMEGSMTVESASGQGATVILRFLAIEGGD